MYVDFVQNWKDDTVVYLHSKCTAEKDTQGKKKNPPKSRKTILYYSPIISPKTSDFTDEAS